MDHSEPFIDKFMVLYMAGESSFPQGQSMRATILCNSALNINFLVTVLLVGITALAAEFKVTESHVNFLAVGKPAMIKIRGEGDCLGGKFIVSGKELVIQAECDLTKMKTGVELRDTHMREKYLEVAKFPRATFEGSAAFVKGKNSFQGKMTLHGKTVPVKGDVEVKGEELKFWFVLKVSDFEIPIPEYLGVKVADEVNVSIALKGSVL